MIRHHKYADKYSDSVTIKNLPSVIIEKMMEDLSEARNYQIISTPNLSIIIHESGELYFIAFDDKVEINHKHLEMFEAEYAELSVKHRKQEI